MNEEAALIRAIVDSPGDETARLVFADWLDDRDDPRGAYLRAEVALFRIAPRGSSRFRRARAKLEASVRPEFAVWAARVGRPPVGVCTSAKLFVPEEKPTTEKAVAAVEKRFGVTFPAQYRAFLLNYNGGGFLWPLPEPDPTVYAEWFAGIKLGKHSRIPELAEIAESAFEAGDDVNRDSGLFPIGGPDHERMWYLLGVAGEFTGRVFLIDGIADPWVESEYRSDEASSMGALLAERERSE